MIGLLMRFSSFARLLPGALVVLGSLSSLPAAPPLWGMRAGDSFVADLMIIRETSIRLAGADPQQWVTRERFGLEYRVENVAPTGRLFIRVRIIDADREVGAAAGSGRTQPSVISDQRLGMLSDMQLLLEVSSDGVVERVSTGDRKALISNMAGLNTSAFGIMDECFSEETVKSWFARPLWFFRDPQELNADQSWDRLDQISLGTLGVFRTAVRIQPVDPVSDEPVAGDPVRSDATLKLSGTSRFIPSISGQKNSQTGSAERPLIPLSDTSAEMDQYIGTARLKNTAIVDPRRAARRPFFESLDLEIAFHGTCEATFGNATQTIEFRQKQVQSWLLRTWRIGGPFLSGQQELMIVPQPVPEPDR